MKKTKHDQKITVDFTEEYPLFTQDMKKDYTILIPDMLPWHFELFTHAIRQEGYRCEVLHNEGRAVIDEGLKHLHNDMCFPALCVLGQYFDALKSGKYDLDKTAVLIIQSGGGCRASNYISLYRKAFRAEYPQIPVLSLNFVGLEKGNGLVMSFRLLKKLSYGIYYGDLIMWLFNQVKPYEQNEGDADRVRLACIEAMRKAYDDGSYTKFKRWVKYLLNAYAAVPVNKGTKVKVGIVGEIYVKYSPLGNSHLEDFLLSEGCEPVAQPLLEFVLYCVINGVNDAKFYGINKKLAFIYRLAYKAMYKKERQMIKWMKEQGRFQPFHDFEHLRSLGDKVCNQGVKMGEGWVIPAEMAGLSESGVDNIVCAQPFGCLPNHIAGKGATRAVKDLYPDLSVVPVDYDPSATRVNQENRIKLMLATAREKLNRNA